MADAKDGPFCEGCKHWVASFLGKYPAEQSHFGYCAKTGAYRWTFDVGCDDREMNSSSLEGIDEPL